jgi:hypothetical protein
MLFARRSASIGLGKTGDGLRVPFPLSRRNMRTLRTAPALGETLGTPPPEFLPSVSQKLVAEVSSSGKLAGQQMTNNHSLV